jgi:lysophosphatidic acid acyltransferase/lysophosphatidylinositol acyltransferase
LFPNFEFLIYLFSFLVCVFVIFFPPKTIEETFKNLRTTGLPFWMLSHVEGTRINLQKLAESQDYAKKNDLPILEYSLLPRTKGFVATVQGLRDKLDAVYDVTILYQNKKTGKTEGVKGPNLFEAILRKASSNAHIHVRRYPIQSLPKDDLQLSKWCLDRWKEKDQLIKDFQKSGHFPREFVSPWKHQGIAC